MCFHVYILNTIAHTDNNYIQNCAARKIMRVQDQQLLIIEITAFLYKFIYKYTLLCIYCKRIIKKNAFMHLFTSECMRIFKNFKFP